MKNKYHLLIPFLCLAPFVNIQAQVSHAVQNKNFLIEKGTGQVCGSCPDIAKKCDTVIDSHPGRGMLIEYHFGPDAAPQAGALAQDFRTSYGDTIYNPSPNGLHWPFYLNMMVNRKDRGVPYGSTFIFGPNNNQVQPEADLVVNEVSPVNLYMAPSYNPNTRLLTVYAEVYYTANAATDSNYLQIAITEDSIISTQYDPLNYTQNNGFNPNFNHTNVFRANINGFAGDLITTTTQGTTISRTYTYTMPTMYRNIACNPQHCKLTMYIADKKAPSGIQSFTGKIMTAVRTNFYGATPAGINDFTETTEVNVYPNPASGQLTVQAGTSGSYSLVITDITGRNVYSSVLPFTLQTTVDVSGFTKGIYLIHVQSEHGITVQKVVCGQ